MGFKKLEFTPREIEMLINLYTHGMSDNDVASYFSVHPNRLRRYLQRKENLAIKQRVERNRVATRMRMRQALFQKGVGTDYRAGKPTVLNADGSVKEEGVAASVAMPGDLSAMKMWLQNCDDGKEWLDRNQHQMTGPKGEPLKIEVEHMSNKELVNFVCNAINEGVVSANALKLETPPKTNGRVVHAKYTEEKSP